MSADNAIGKASEETHASTPAPAAAPAPVPGFALSASVPTQAVRQKFKPPHLNINEVRCGQTKLIMI